MVDLRLWIRHPNTGYLQNRRDPACLRQAGGVPVALAGAVPVGTVVAHVAVVRWCRGGGCAAHRCGNRCTGEPCTATAKRLLRTETEMRAANPEPASALWPRHIVAHGGWDMRSRACRAPDSTCDPRGSTQTGAQRAARPPIRRHTLERPTILLIQEGTRGMLHSGLRAARPELRTASLLPDIITPLIRAPQRHCHPSPRPVNALPCPDRAVITNGERHGLICERSHL